MADRIPNRRPARMAGLLSIVALALPACDGAAHPTALEPTGSAHATVAGAVSPALLDAHPALGAEVAALRAATARYHRIETAVQDGYSVLVRHPESGAACLESEAGGMGRHLLNPALVDDEVVVTAPEVLIYEPTENGRMRLVGVEYVIPYAIRGVDESPPELFGQALERNATFGLWALHVYAWKDNPDGLFAGWNPMITCAHDPEA